LAHIRRYDYLVNLLQTFTETVLFFHPVVWLLSRRIRVEREYCCDDVAIATCGGRTKYVSALAAVERSRQTPQFAMTFLNGNENMTLKRIRRIMGVSASFPHAWLSGSGACLLLVVLLFTGMVARNELTAAPNEGETESSRGEVRKSPNMAPWGESVEGFEARLRADRVDWKLGETPVLKADVRNNGKRDLVFTKAQQPCEIEFDGKWYKWNGGFALKTSPLPPGRQDDDIRISLVEN
jgi:hypothetical protein